MKTIKKAYVIIFLLLLQSVCLMGIINYNFANQVEIVTIKFPYIIIFFNNILAVISIFIIRNIIKILKMEKESMEKLNDSKEVIMALKAQKHDFKNHLSVIAGMIQLNKQEQALQYIYKISDNVEAGFAISKIENIELAATLYRKCAIAENKGIKVRLQINSSLENLHIDSIDLCKIVFNLVDNAIYALGNHISYEEKVLTVIIDENNNHYTISIRNSHPILSADSYTWIFEKGYTTKKEQGEEHGYGLYIVKQLVEKHKGVIQVKSETDFGTDFTVYFPKD